jgi:hypothetical protein
MLAQGLGTQATAAWASTRLDPDPATFGHLNNNQEGFRGPSARHFPQVPITIYGQRTTLIFMLGKHFDQFVGETRSLVQPEFVI